jgi:hypothetical protein
MEQWLGLLSYYDNVGNKILRPKFTESDPRKRHRGSLSGVKRTKLEADRSPQSDALRIRGTVLPQPHTFPCNAVLINIIQRRSRVLLKETGPSAIFVKLLFV